VRQNQKGLMSVKTENVDSRIENIRKKRKDSILASRKESNNH